MDALDLLIEALGEDGALIVALMALAGGGLAIILVVNFLRGRSDVRRRAAAEDIGAPRSTKSPGGRADAQQSLNRLMTYVESTFTGGNEQESRVLRRQMIQAGF